MSPYRAVAAAQGINVLRIPRDDAYCVELLYFLRRLWATVLSGEAPPDDFFWQTDADRYARCVLLRGAASAAWLRCQPTRVRSMTVSPSPTAVRAGSWSTRARSRSRRSCTAAATGWASTAAGSRTPRRAINPFQNPFKKQLKKIITQACFQGAANSD